MKGSLTLVWDIDDVLNRLMLDWLEFEWRPRHSNCAISYADLSSNPPLVAIGASLSQYQQSLDSFHASSRGRNLEPVPEVIRWFEKYGARYRHIALTARPLDSTPHAAEWVLRHYGRWIRAFGFVPSSRSYEQLPLYDTNKTEWLRWVGAGDVLIDDSPSNLADASAAGLQTFTVPQPWNDGSGTLEDLLGRIASL